MAKIYPRLESFEYEDRIQFVANQIKSKGCYNYTATDSDLRWLPMGNRAELTEIENLRSNIIHFMCSENLNPIASAQERTAFDRKLGLKLLEWIDITPSIAADNGMWAYMNIILFPELIQVRWGYNEKGEPRKINHERYYDTNRSYLKKLWFTAYLINDKDLYMKLKQDEIDVWYDKSFNRGLDNYIHQIYIAFYKNVNDVKATIELGDLYRRFLKLINRKLAYINYYALNNDNFTLLLNECFATAYKEYKGKKEQPQIVKGLTNNGEKIIGSIGINEFGASTIKDPIIIKLTSYMNNKFLDIRKVYEKDGKWRPTHTGVTLNKKQIIELIDILWSNMDKINDYLP